MIVRFRLFAVEAVRVLVAGYGLSRRAAVWAGGLGLVAMMGQGFLRAQTVSSVSGTVNFGTVTVATGSQTETLTFTFGTGGTVLAPVVLTQGATGLDFTDAGTGTCTTNGAGYSYAAFATCTVVVKFVPAYPGVRMGAVELMNSAGGLVATQLIYGVGNGPQGAFVPGTLSTVAGSGATCSSSTAACGDGGQATSAAINWPYGSAVDGQGNIYFSDATDNRVRKVSPAGVITTYAGNGTACSGSLSSCGDGGPATSAELNDQGGVAVDGAGNLYIADYSDNVIRKVTAATGIISTIAGTGVVCPNPTATTGACGDGGPATSATLNQPNNVAVDGAGNLYTVGSENRVRMISASTGMILTIAGNGSSCSASSRVATSNPCGDGYTASSGNTTVSTPIDVAVDAAGNVYIADGFDFRVRMVAAGTGVLSTVAGNGSSCDGSGCATGIAAINTALFPFGIDVDAAGNLYITAQSGAIYKVSHATGILSLLAGSATTCGSSSAGCGDGGSATASTAEFGAVYLAKLDAAGNLYISDQYANRLRKVTAAAYGISFGSQVVGTASASSAVTMANIGTSSLLTSTFATTSDDFTLLTPTGYCVPALSIGSGNSCTVNVEFTPQSVDALIGDVTVTDKNLNVTGATQLIPLSGTGTGDPTTLIEFTTLPNGSVVEASDTTPPAGNVIAAGASAGVVTVALTDASGNINATSTDQIQLVVQQMIPITAYSISSNVVTFTAVNSLTAGQTVTLSGFGTSTFLNGQTVTVISTGLSATQFEASYTHATAAATETGLGTSSGAAAVTYKTGVTSGYVSPTIASGIATFDLSTVFQKAYNGSAVYKYTISDVANSAIAPVSSYVNVVEPSGARVMLVNVFNDTNNSEQTAKTNCTEQNIAFLAANNCSLRDALTVAYLYSGSTILFNYTGSVITIAPTTYALSSGTGSGNAADTLIYLPTTISGPGPGKLIITGAGSTSGTTPTLALFRDSTSASGTLNLSGMTLEYGSGGTYAGGLYLYAPANITNVTFYKNTATSDGGAIYMGTPTGSVTINNCTFNSNSANIGGAIYDNTTTAGSTLTITNSTFNGNQGTTSAGGGIYIPGVSNLTVSGSQFVSNSSGTNGGAISYSSSSTTAATLTVSNSVFTSNTAGSYGGAVAVPGGVTANISTSQFSGNTATTSGGALALQNANNNILTTTLVNDTFYNNTANGSYGGAIYLAGLSGYYGSTTMEYLTVVGNKAPSGNGGGIYAAGYSNFSLTNSVVEANTAKSTSYADVVYNSGTHTFPGTLYSSISGAPSPYSIATLGLTALGSYGGATAGSSGNTVSMQTLVPAPGSVLLKYSTASPIAGVATDQRGVTRATSGGTGLVDIGAVETNESLVFMSTVPSSTTVGTPFSPQPTVELEDDGYALPVAVPVTMSLSSGTLSGTATTVSTSATTGVATFSGLYSDTPETGVDLVAKVGSGSSALEAVLGGFNITSSVSQLVFTTAPASSVTSTGNAGSVVVTIENSSSAAVTNDNSVITLTVTGPDDYAATYTATASGGAATFNLSGVALNTAGSYTYTASYPSGLYATTASETVTAGAVTHLEVSEPSVTTAGFAESTTVKALDAGQNVVPTFTGTATLTSNDPLAVLPASYTFTAGDNGVHAFTTTLKTVGTQTITGTSSMPSDTGTQTSVVVQDSVWLVNAAGSVLAVSEQGSALTGAVGTTTTAGVGGVAFDSTGGVWSVTSGTAALDYVSANGTGSAMYSGGGLSGPRAVAVDGAGYVWVANSTGASVSAFTNAGVAQSGTSGYGASCSGMGCVPAIGPVPSGVAIDNSGGVWVVSKSGNSVTHLVGAGAPVTVPLASATAAGTVGVEP